MQESLKRTLGPTKRLAASRRQRIRLREFRFLLTLGTLSRAVIGFSTIGTTLGTRPLVGLVGYTLLIDISTVGVLAKRYIIYWRALRDVCAEAFDCSARTRDSHARY